MDYFDLNRLLRSLSPSDKELLRSGMSRVELERGRVLETIGVQTEQAFFIETALAAVVAHSPGREIGIGVLGNDGMTGLDIVLDAGHAANETLVQSAGTSICISSASLEAALEESSTLRNVLLRYAHVFTVQTSQTALTNILASVEERLARWILMSHDRFYSNDLKVTHEFISLMVGVRRQGITEALHVLEGQKFIKSTRDNIHVLNRAGLIDLASGSYGVCEAEYERLIDREFRKNGHEE